MELCLHELDAFARPEHLGGHRDLRHRHRAEDVHADPHDVSRPCPGVLLDRARQQRGRRPGVLQPRIPRTAGVLGGREPPVAEREVEGIGGLAGRHGAAIYPRDRARPPARLRRRARGGADLADATNAARRPLAARWASRTRGIRRRAPPVGVVRRPRTGSRRRCPRRSGGWAAPAARSGAVRRGDACGRGVGRPTVVVYDDAGGTSAARAWWLLVHHGHGGVRLLDGGLAAWRAAGRTLEKGPGDPPPGDWTPQTPGRLPVLDAEAARAVAQQGALLDARAPERYRGEVEPVDPVAGHIPGARNAPGSAWIGPDSLLLSPTEILRRLDGLGVSREKPIGAYCGSGVVASLSVLALATAGLDVALYPGSWSDWVADSDRPVATGEEP